MKQLKKDRVQLNHEDYEIDSIAYELGLMADVDETSDIDKPLFTDVTV